MTIPRTEYKGFELTAYADQVFPTHHDPYALGPRRYASVVRIEQMSPGDGRALRYTTQTGDTAPASMRDALDSAISFGRSIVDGGFKVIPLESTPGISDLH